MKKEIRIGERTR